MFTNVAFGFAQRRKAGTLRSFPLPGLATQGETIEEAIENVKDAFRAVAAEYAESGSEIPWRKETDRAKPHGTIEKWILVNV